MTWSGAVESFRAAGLPPRAMYALAYGGVRGLADLRSRPWPDLRAHLLGMPNCGPRTVDTIEAFLNAGPVSGVAIPGGTITMAPIPDDRPRVVRDLPDPSAP